MLFESVDFCRTQHSRGDETSRYSCTRHLYEQQLQCLLLLSVVILSPSQGSIPYDTGEHDGIKIEFVGTATGTLPDPAHETAVANQENQLHIPVSSLGSAKLDVGDGGASIAKEEGALELELLRCAGEIGTKGATQDGGLTLRKIGDNMLHKLMRSAKKVATCMQFEEGARFREQNGMLVVYGANKRVVSGDGWFIVAGLSRWYPPRLDYVNKMRSPATSYPESTPP